MKRILALALAGSMLASLAGCGGKDSGTASSTPPASNGSSTSVAEPAKVPDPAPESTGLDAGNITVKDSYWFKGGLAGIRFTDTAKNISYTGFLDESGKLLFYGEGSGKFNLLTSNSSHPDLSQDYGYDYDGDYIYFNTKNNFYVLNRNGEITASYSKSDEAMVAGYGEGYVITRTANTGFDASGAVAHIYDPSGKEVSSIQSDTGVDGGHAGGGIFVINRDSLYFTKTDTLLSGLSIEENYFYGWGQGFSRSENGFVVYACADNFSYANTEGEHQTIARPAEIPPYAYYYGETNGILLLQGEPGGGERTISIYDTKSGQVKTYQGAYADRIEDILRSVCGNGLFGIALCGSDGQTYTQLLNENMEEVGEPVLGQPFAIYNSCLYTATNDESVITYNLQGEELCRAELQYTGYFDSGIIQSYKNLNGRSYYHPDGTELEIDFSTGKLVTLPE